MNNLTDEDYNLLEDKIIDSTKKELEKIYKEKEKVDNEKDSNETMSSIYDDDYDLKEEDDLGLKSVNVEDYSDDDYNLTETQKQELKDLGFEFEEDVKKEDKSPNNRKLDLSAVAMVQDNYKRKKGLKFDLAKIATRDVEEFELTDDNEIAHDMDSPEFRSLIGKAIEKMMENSIQDKNNSKVQPCRGEHYAIESKRKKNLANVLKIILAAVALGLIIKGTSIAFIVGEYDRYLKAELKERYTTSELSKMDNPNFFEKLDDFNKAYDELDKDDYSFGSRKDGIKTSRKFNKEPDFLYINDQTADAIINATEERIQQMDDESKGIVR